MLIRRGGGLRCEELEEQGERGFGDVMEDINRTRG